MYKVLLLFLLTISLLCAEEVTVDLSTVTLSKQTQKTLENYAEEKAELEQEYRAAMEKLKAKAIEDLNKQHKRSDALEQMAIEQHIKTIEQKQAINVFGEVIKAPLPALLQSVLDGRKFRRRVGSELTYQINGKRAMHESGVFGDVVVHDDHIQIDWETGPRVSIHLDEHGLLTLTRNKKHGGQSFELIIVE